MRKYGFHDWNSCLATIGHGGLKEGQIVNKMYEEYKRDHLARITDEEVLETIGAENKNPELGEALQERNHCQGTLRCRGSFFQVLQPGAGR